MTHQPNEQASPDQPPQHVLDHRDRRGRARPPAPGRLRAGRSDPGRHGPDSQRAARQPGAAPCRDPACSSACWSPSSAAGPDDHRTRTRRPGYVRDPGHPGRAAGACRAAGIAAPGGPLRTARGRQLNTLPSAAVVGLVVSPGHNYWFWSHDPADGVGPHPTSYPDQVEVVAGRGIRGDRFFGRATRLASSVSFVAAEALEAVENDLGLAPGSLDPRLTRRNIVTRGVDLNALRHRSFGLDTGDGTVWFERGRGDQPVRLDGRPPRARCARCAARPWRLARQPDELRCPAPPARRGWSSTGSTTRRGRGSGYDGGACPGEVRGAGAAARCRRRTGSRPRRRCPGSAGATAPSGRRPAARPPGPRPHRRTATTRPARRTR